MRGGKITSLVRGRTVQRRPTRRTFLVGQRSKRYIDLSRTDRNIVRNNTNRRRSRARVDITILRHGRCARRIYSAAAATGRAAVSPTDPTDCCSRSLRDLQVSDRFWTNINRTRFRSTVSANPHTLRGRRKRFSRCRKRFSRCRVQLYVVDAVTCNGVECNISYKCILRHA